MELDLTAAAQFTWATVQAEAEAGAADAVRSQAIYLLWGALTGLRGPELARLIHTLTRAPKPVTVELEVS